MAKLVCGWLEAISQDGDGPPQARPAISPHDEAHFLRVGLLPPLSRPDGKGSLLLDRIKAQYSVIVV